MATKTLGADAVYAALDKLNIAYQLHHHEPLFTVEESQKLRGEISGGHCKNLFLKSKKGKLCLLVVLEDKKVDLKRFEKIVAQGRLSFGKAELLMEILGVIPGAVTPFAVINDHEKQVDVYLDKDMLDYDILNYHPLDNRATCSIAASDLIPFLNAMHKNPEVISIPVIE